MAQGLCRGKKLGKELMDSFFLSGNLIFWIFVLPYSDNWRCELGLARPCGCSKVVLGVTKGGSNTGKRRKKVVKHPVLPPPVVHSKAFMRAGTLTWPLLITLCKETEFPPEKHPWKCNSWVKAGVTVQPDHPVWGLCRASVLCSAQRHLNLAL